MLGLLQRSLASVVSLSSSAVQSMVVQSSKLLMKPNLTTLLVQPSMSYRVRAVLELRCKGCRFEKRVGRLFVECSLKPRHKQMQLISKEKQRRMMDADAERFPKNIVQLPSIHKAVMGKAIRYQLRQALGH